MTPAHSDHWAPWQVSALPACPAPATFGAACKAAGAPAPIRPTAGVVPSSVNHRLPSAPGAIAYGSLPAFRPLENSVI